MVWLRVLPKPAPLSRTENMSCPCAGHVEFDSGHRTRTRLPVHSTAGFPARHRSAMDLCAQTALIDVDAGMGASAGLAAHPISGCAMSLRSICWVRISLQVRQEVCSMPSSCAFIRLAPAMRCGPASAARLRSTVAARFPHRDAAEPTMARSGARRSCGMLEKSSSSLFNSCRRAIAAYAAGFQLFVVGQLRFGLLRVVMSIIMHSSPSQPRVASGGSGLKAHNSQSGCEIYPWSGCPRHPAPSVARRHCRAARAITVATGRAGCLPCRCQTCRQYWPLA